MIITAGLAEGDQVIVDNLVKVRPGAAVQPHPPGSGPTAQAAEAGSPGAAPAPGAPAQGAQKPAQPAQQGK
jgi:membrane fusion protein (multidrug efflux system)